MPCEGIFSYQYGRIVNPAGVLRSACERRVATADRGGPALGLLPVFLTPQGGHVQEGVGAAHRVGAPGEGRVGVEDFVALAQEAAHAGQLGGPVAVDPVRLVAVVV